MTQENTITLEYPKPRDAWDTLSMKEKAEMIGVAVRNGITNLNDIRYKYNEFAEGGNIYDGESQPSNQMITTGGTGYFPDNYGQGSIDTIRRRLYKNITPFGYHAPISRTFNAIALNQQDDTRAEENKRIKDSVPEASALDAIWATYLNIPENQRRNINSKYGISKTKDGYYRFNNPNMVIDFEHDLSSEGLYSLPKKSATMMNGILGNYAIGLGRDDKGDYIFYSDSKLNPDRTPNIKTGWDINPYSNTVDDDTEETTEEHGQYGQDKKDLSYKIGKALFGNMEDISMGIGTPVPIYDRIYLDDYYGLGKEQQGGHYLPEITVYGNKHSLGGPLVEAANEYKKGGGIHIAPSKKGTFTAAAKKHGKSVQAFASQVLAHPENYSPAMRKKANFARNSRKWKHGLGGNLFDGTSQNSQQMQIGLDVQGWPDYTTEQIVAYGNENERRRKAIQDAYLNFVTESNDATAVANGKPQNKHLIDKAVQGAKANATWEKEHPTLNTWGNVLSAVPFAVATAPAGAWGLAGMSALGDAAAATSAGQAITVGLAPLATAASTSVAGAPLYTWADAGLSSIFGGHGIQEAAEGNFTPMTALEIAPLGRLAKPVAKEVASSMRNYRYPLGKPQIPKDFPILDSKVILADDKINDTSFFTWGNDSRFKVSPFKETYKDLYNQLSAAKRYKESPEYAKLVSEARKNSEALGFGDFPEDLFVAPNGKSVDIVFESRPKGQLGEYVPEKNAMFLDMTQAEGMEVPYHEGIHWQRVGNPSNIGPRFNKWWKARKSNQPDNIQRQLFDDFRNSEEYNRFVKRRNADNYIEHEVNESLYPFADDYLRAKGELQAHGLEAGRAVGIEPFTPYPGTVEALEAIEKARKYDPYLKDVKSGGEENVERFWKILTGQLTPALIPVGLIGTKYNLNTK